MVTTIICVFLWIPDILKELRNVLYEAVFFLAVADMLLSRKVDKTILSFKLDQIADSYRIWSKSGSVVSEFILNIHRDTRFIWYWR